ncbi:MAG: hypothetical protein M3264_15105 [Thermoproteota archaeon]|nr:hypothetical protein [Thermoproteota archaeon]
MAESSFLRLWLFSHLITSKPVFYLLGITTKGVDIEMSEKRFEENFDQETASLLSSPIDKAER